MSETIIQIINALLSIVYVLLEGSASMWLWPLGVIQPIFALIVGWQSQTYSTIFVQLYYFITCIIGWVSWHRRRHETIAEERPQIRHISRRGALISAAVTLVGFVLIRYFVETVSPYPIIEAAGTALCFLGMYFVIKAYVEAWYIWILSNLLYTVLYFMIPGYAYTGILYALLALLAVRGLIAWRRKARTDRSLSDTK
jgi:nicotinamide mononucleotide transporter